MQKLSIIVSAYNEAGGIGKFFNTAKKYAETLKDKGFDYEFVFVDDGSADGTSEILDRIADTDPLRVRIFHFSRNFGHEAAMTAGMDNAVGDVLIFMDADLQHPPKLLPDIVDKFNDGYDIVMMSCTKNESAGLMKEITSKGFYWLINKLSDVRIEPNASDFFAITKGVAEVVKDDYCERTRFLRGFVQSIGFKKAVIEYEAADRIAGKSHYSIRKLFKFAMNTLVCFSDVPLKLGIFSGIVTGLIGFIILIISLITGTFYGFTAVTVLLLILFAILFILIGIIGEYLSVMFGEIKKRPVYIISKKKDKTHGGLVNTIG